MRLANNSNNISAFEIKITGLVQGVGFRPYIYRLATSLHIKGWVKNLSNGVLVHIEGPINQTDQFLKRLPEESPPASSIEHIQTKKSKALYLSFFTIEESENIKNQISEISPDIAVCEDCLSDMKNQQNRIDYPFINCINCGPRFTIIKDFPYDRKNTTMDVFTMCKDCAREFEDVTNRRFHTQPNACKNCGPKYQLITKKSIITKHTEILTQVSDLLNNGKIIAIKGLGGFHLMCDATNENTVNYLREIKQRDAKPFAVMFRDIDSAKEFVEINNKAEEILLSWKRPIVILPAKKELASGISNGLHTIGSFLPYMPIHYMIFEKCNLPALVLTSGNIADEPIVIDNQLAADTFFPKTDAVLTYNREIYNRTDDSVLKIMDDKPSVLRRSRGYAPNPVKLDYKTEGILATGAELVNCFCIGKDYLAILSQHIGDLKNPETLEFYTNTIERFKQLLRSTPQLTVADLHPDYLSTRYALEQKTPVHQVQHHHAHIASCMAEHGLNEKVIGISMDGTGYGADGNIWGGEFLICDLQVFERISHFDYVPLIGGDKAIKEPWRIAFSFLYHYFKEDFLDIDLFSTIPEKTIQFIKTAIDNRINSPLTSSAGRLFDAVSALTGICTHSGFHAEAPMRLEDAIIKNNTEKYAYDMDDTICFASTLKGIIQDLQKKKPVGEISTKFHNTAGHAIVDKTVQICKETGLKKVVLSGGTFQNAYLTELLITLLTHNNLTVYTQESIPCNDGGIALGQIAIGAYRREKGII